MKMLFAPMNKKCKYQDALITLHQIFRCVFFFFFNGVKSGFVFKCERCQRNFLRAVTAKILQIISLRGTAIRMAATRRIDCDGLATPDWLRPAPRHRSSEPGRPASAEAARLAPPEDSGARSLLEYATHTYTFVFQHVKCLKCPPVLFLLLWPTIFVSATLRGMVLSKNFQLAWHFFFVLCADHILNTRSIHSKKSEASASPQST